MAKAKRTAQTTTAQSKAPSLLDALRAKGATRPQRGAGVGKVSATSGPHKDKSKLEVVSYMLTEELVAQLTEGKQRTDDELTALLGSWFPDGTTFQKWNQYRSYYAQWGNPKRGAYKGCGPVRQMRKGKGSKAVVTIAKTDATSLLDDVAKSLGATDGLALCTTVFANWQDNKVRALLTVANPSTTDDTDTDKGDSNKGN